MRLEIFTFFSLLAKNVGHPSLLLFLCRVCSLWDEDQWTVSTTQSFYIFPHTHHSPVCHYVKLPHWPWWCNNHHMQTGPSAVASSSSSPWPLKLWITLNIRSSSAHVTCNCTTAEWACLVSLGNTVHSSPQAPRSFMQLYHDCMSLLAKHPTGEI